MFHLSRYRLHGLFLNAFSIGKNGQRISFEARIRKNIERVEAMTHGVAGKTELQLFQFSERPFISDISGIQGGLRLEKKNLRLLLGDWKMLDAARHDDEFAR